MALIGNQLASSENNSYRVLDNLASFTLTFDGSSSSNILASTDTINLSQHPFITGQRVTYSSGGGSPIGGLLSGTAYYITKTDQNSFQLATSYVNAITNITIDLVGTGTGVTHSFNVAFDGINTKFKATYSNGTKCTISRAAQLDIAINGVVQQPYDSNPPPNGFTIEADATIVFSTAPLAGYTFWGKALSGSIASVENSDNSIDNFTGNGSTTNFTLSKTPVNSQNVLVDINGVTQYPSDATGTRSYSVNANVLAFTAAPANGSLIQVRYIGFAGATSSSVTGFYGRTGNVVLNTNDTVSIGAATIGVGAAGTTLLVTGNARITGILTIGTGSITLDGTNNTISGVDQTNINNTTVLGIATFRNGPVIIGTSSSTGTAGQVLQATGGAYVSGSLGVGVTVFGNKLRVNKDLGTNDYINVAQHSSQFQIGRASDNKSLEFAVLDNGTSIIQSKEASVGYNNLALQLAGNLGVGITNPTTTLQVQGTGQFVAASSNSSTTNSAIWANTPLQTVSAFFGNGATTSGLTGDQYSTSIRFNGSNVGWGDISYYPNQGGQGHFRFSIAGSSVITTPNATVGVGALYTPGQITSTQANSTTTGGGQIYLNGATGNRIDFNQNGGGAPAFTTRSSGTKIVLYPGVSASGVDYAFGIDSLTLWSSVYDSTAQFKWYAGTTNIATLSGAGALTVAASLNYSGNLTNYGKLNHYTTEGTATNGQNRMAARLYTLGKKLYVDETFLYGTNSLNVYDNAATGTVSITRVSSSGLNAPNNSGYVAQITHTGSSQSPGYGGFYFGTATRANATLACVFRAKLPSGYTINYHSNATGSNGSSYWATDNFGTGKWEDYVYVVRCGDSGTFSSTHFYAITGSPAPSAGSPLTWYLASATVYDVDDRTDGAFAGPISANTQPFFRNIPTIATDYTVTTTYNEMSIGPITINNGITVTVNSGATWTVV